MRTALIRGITALMIVAVAAGCATQAPAPAPVDTAGIQTAIAGMETAFAQAVNARDTTALWNYYADDASILPANAPRVDGSDAYRVMWRELLAMPGLEMTATSNQVIISQAGDMVVDLGKYTMKFNDAKGKPMEDTGKFVTVYRKTDAGWKAIVDTFNSDMPMPGMYSGYEKPSAGDPRRHRGDPPRAGRRASVRRAGAFGGPARRIGRRSGSATRRQR